MSGDAPEDPMMQIKSDEEIQRDVLGELKWDSRVDEAEVGVSVAKGVVTLSGTVSSYVKQLAAQEAAHRVRGVLDVANDLQVKLPGGLTRSDSEIAHAVRHTLEWDVLVPDDQITSTVSHGWVTLEGKVDLLRERVDAERAIRQLIGVRGVSNDIAVVGPPLAPDEVRRTVEEVLARRAEREAEGIAVTVHDGTVTLAGQVSSWAEKRAIMGAVSHARGLRTVTDRLRVEPYG
jgi:osmotically-inducible protein OsmY